MTDSTELLFQAATIAEMNLKNRIAMAPMTRSRTSQPGDVPNDMMATYYGQRANAGLIVTEGAPISAIARGYSMTPGIYTQAHIDGWKKTTQAIHQVGSKAFIQLWHVGRRSHSIIAGAQPLAPSAIKIPDQVFGPLPEGGFGMIETEAPRAMTQADIEQTIADFVQAAKNAMEAGFDGVEIHAAHGYLFDSFMRTHSNAREDQYGGSVENRTRFLVETIAAICQAIGNNRVAIRVSPYVSEGAAEFDAEMPNVIFSLLEQIKPLKIAYVHFSENISRYQEVPESFRQQVCEIYPHPIMIAGKLTKESAENLLQKGYADLVAFGTPFVTNPDLVVRLQNNWPLAEFDADARLTLYGGGEEGYIDYPVYQEA